MVYGTTVVDREFGDRLVKPEEKCDGPPVPSKSYHRRVLISSDFVSSVIQFCPAPPSYLPHAQIDNVLFYLFDSQRLASSGGLPYSELEICIQVHVDHRKRARYGLINNAWMFDPDLDRPPPSNMIERPPMSATGTHPTKPSYPKERMIITTHYIQSCHPAHQITHFLIQYHQRFNSSLSPPNRNRSNISNVPVAAAPSPNLSQYRSSPDNQTSSHHSSSVSYVSILATSILWYNNID